MKKFFFFSFSNCFLLWALLFSGCGQSEDDNSSLTTKGKTGRAAYSEAKKDAGIRPDQKPYQVERVDMTTHTGQRVPNSRPGQVYQEYYHTPNGNVVLQNHPFGHPNLGEHRSHWHVRPEKDLRHDTAKGAQDHYYYERRQYQPRPNNPGPLPAPARSGRTPPPTCRPGAFEGWNGCGPGSGPGGGAGPSQFGGPGAGSHIFM
jgi:hypothetical protein